MIFTSPSGIALDPRRNPSAVWARAHGRLDPEVWPQVRPRFKLAPSDRIFTIGSCFARNVEANLERLGYDVPVRRYHSRPELMIAGAASEMLNKYTPPAIFQELQWAFEARERRVQIAEKLFFFELPDGTVLDTNLNDLAPVTPETARARRTEIAELYDAVVTSACVVLTLGQIEAWYDKEKSLYIQHAPSTRLFGAALDRFEFRLLSFAECLDFVDRAVRLIRSVNPDVKCLLTTSPVAMNRTFTDDDVITAYMHTKAVLRAVCGEIRYAYDFVDYLPVFESAVLTKSWAGWAPDKLHVTDEFVGKVLGRLVDSYLEGADAAAQLYQRSYTAEKSGDLSTALELAEQAVSLEAATSHMFLHHARLLSMAGKFDAALVSANRANDLEPGSGEILAAIAQAHAKLGVPEDALRHARAAVAAEPRHAGYRVQLANILAEAGDLDEAEVQIRQAMDLLPRFGRFNMDLALVLEKAGRVQEAIEQAAESVRVWPDVGALRVMCADLLFRNGQAEEAARQQTRAIELGVKHAVAHWRLATMLEKLGDRSGAIRAAEAAVSAEPQDQALRQFLSALQKTQRSEPAN